MKNIKIHFFFFLITLIGCKNPSLDNNVYLENYYKMVYSRDGVGETYPLDKFIEEIGNPIDTIDKSAIIKNPETYEDKDFNEKLNKGLKGFKFILRKNITLKEILYYDNKYFEQNKSVGMDEEYLGNYNMTCELWVDPKTNLVLVNRSNLYTEISEEYSKSKLNDLIKYHWIYKSNGKLKGAWKFNSDNTFSYGGDVNGIPYQSTGKWDLNPGGRFGSYITVKYFKSTNGYLPEPQQLLYLNNEVWVGQTIYEKSLGE
jgi:hypothetical protein